MAEQTPGSAGPVRRGGPECSESRTFYICTDKVHGVELEHEAGGLWYSPAERSLESGPGFYDDPSRSESDAAKTVVVYSADEKHLVRAERRALAELTFETFLLLVAIAKTPDRLAVYSDSAWLDEGTQLAKGDRVRVLQKDEEFYGAVRFKGALDGLRGIWFGVAYDEPYWGKGSCDGTFRRVPLFACGKNCAVFVSLAKVRKLHLGSVSPANGTSSRSCEGGVCVGDRVVWHSDFGPELGTARWLGPLPDLTRRDIYVGVEFDRAVGKGNGKYRGVQLFVSKRDHASLIPLMGLMLARDFTGELTQATEESGDAAAARSDAFDIVGIRASLLPDVVAGESAARDRQRPPPPPPHDEQRTTDHEQLDVGSRVEVLENPPRYGVLRWIGSMPDQETTTANSSSTHQLAGLEMDEEDPACYTDGTLDTHRLFQCAPHKALFIHLNKCRPDSRPNQQQRQQTAHPAPQSEHRGDLLHEYSPGGAAGTLQSRQ